MELLLLEESLKTTEITTATGAPSPEAAQPHAGTQGDTVYRMEDSGAHKGPRGRSPQVTSLNNVTGAQR